MTVASWGTRPHYGHVLVSCPPGSMQHPQLFCVEKALGSLAGGAASLVEEEEL